MNHPVRGRLLPCLSARPTVLAALACVSSLAAAQSGQTSATTTAAAAALPTVVVTATRTPVRADQTVADVTVLQAEDLAPYIGRTLTEVLANFKYTTKPNGTVRCFSGYGFYFNQ